MSGNSKSWKELGACSDWSIQECPIKYEDLERKPVTKGARILEPGVIQLASGHIIMR